ncbi:DsrE family protein [Marinobacter sp.]|uniref:DsrE family protein n=1 Tax=Marinobacter sp. TaxID=50741 RepID=UPI003568D346
MTTLIIVDQPPYGSWAGREALDMVFSLAAFDQPSALLFIGPGVNWLRTHQTPAELGQKSAEKNLSAASLFGVESIFADQSACEQYRVTQERMLPGVALTSNIQKILNAHNRVAFAG